MIKNIENQNEFKEKILEIYKKYQIDLNNNLYNYKDNLESIWYISDYMFDEENKMKYRKYNGIKYIGMPFKAKTGEIYLYQCLTCGKYFLSSHIHTPLDFNIKRSCKNCSNGIHRQKYPFIPLEHRKKFVDMIWNMHIRCYSPKSPRFNAYGERNIQICPQWRIYYLEPKLSLEEQQEKVQNFYKYCIDLGWDPTKEIDRIDVNKNYEPGNIRFVTGLENLNNRQNNIFYNLKGLSKTIAGWSRFLDIDVQHLRIVFSKYNNDIQKIYENDIQFQINFDEAYENYIQNNVDKDRDALFSKNTRYSVCKSLIYRNIQTSKANWARATGINLSTYDNLLRTYNNDFNILFRNRPDIKEKMDFAIDNGYIQKIMNENKGFKAFSFLGLSSSTTGWARLFEFTLPSSFSTIMLRKNNDFEKMLRERKDIYEKFITNLNKGILDKNSSNKDLEIIGLFSYNGISLLDSDFDNTNYLIELDNYFHQNSLLTNIFPKILKLALNIGYNILDSNLSYIYKSSFKISSNNLNQKEIIKSNNREYIKC